MDTIAAIATPPGRGGIGVIRISGIDAPKIAQALLGRIPRPRYAEYLNFYGAEAVILDQGLALYFPKPHSFTGEDVLELQGHGGSMVLDILLHRVLQLGARLANPGEFSQRAFFNNKIDLTQAEAIADLIDASSEQAMRAAVRSLQGEFAQHIEQIRSDLVKCRIQVEAAIDFSEEAIDFLANKALEQTLIAILQTLQQLKTSARQGVLLREGMAIVITGPPNAGKSSLLNSLSGCEHAIVTAIPGTTRDVIRAEIQIDGLPLHIVDTAGLHPTQDMIEQEGIKRTWVEIEKADRILLVIDSSFTPIVGHYINDAMINPLLSEKKLTVIYNKIDLTKKAVGFYREDGRDVFYLSAKTGQGISLLRDYLKTCAGYSTLVEGNFSARRRHLGILARIEQELDQGLKQWQRQPALELLAAHLNSAQRILGEITGEFTTDDLLGEIFSSFCIGK